jgi:hypothetical protein
VLQYEKVPKVIKTWNLNGAKYTMHARTCAPSVFSVGERARGRKIATTCRAGDGERPKALDRIFSCSWFDLEPAAKPAAFQHYCSFNTVLSVRWAVLHFLWP